MGDFIWEESSLTVHMIEVVDGIPTRSKDGLYLNSADLCAMLERDVETYSSLWLDGDASTLEDFLQRLRLMITNRGPASKEDASE